MPTITPTLWLLAGLTLIILVMLAFIAARRWQQARISANQYRTANRRTIERDTRRIQHLPMATRRVRAGQMPANLPHTAQIHHIKAAAAAGEISINTARRRMNALSAAENPSPPAIPATVQTTAHQPDDEPVAA